MANKKSQYCVAKYSPSRGEAIAISNHSTMKRAKKQAEKLSNEQGKPFVILHGKRTLGETYYVS